MAERSEEQIILDIKVKYAEAIQGIANYNAKLDELKARQQGLKEMYAQGVIAENEYRKSMAATKEAMKENKEETRILSKEIQNKMRVERQNKDSLIALRSELSNLTREYDKLSKAARNGEEGKRIQKQINDITKEIKDAEAETQRFYRNVGNYENAIKNALGLNNSFANSIMGLRNAGDGDIFKGAIMSAQAFGKTLMALLANPAFLACAGIVGFGVTFKWFYDYNQGIAEATRLTREFTGLTGAPLEDIRNSIQATADTFGKDYVDVLKTVDALMAQYHLSASEAIKVVNDGFVAGADLGGNMLSQIQQYAPTFHDAGVKADELVAILAQTRSGIFSEKGMDLIQMASKKIREMSDRTMSALDAIGMSSRKVEADLQSGAKSTFDVIQEISARLRDLPKDSQEVGNVLKDVFGRQGAMGGLQMIEQLDTMTTKMEDVKAVTGEYGELQERQLAANKELNDVLSSMFDMSQNGWEVMIGQIKVVATQWLTSLLKGLRNVINSIIDTYNNTMLMRVAVQSVAFQFKALWAVVKLVFNNIVNAAKGVGKSLRGIAYILEGIFTLNVDKAVQGFKDMFGSIPAAAMESAKDAAKAGKEIAKAGIDAYNNTVNNTPVKHIGASASGAADGVGGTAHDVGGTGVSTGGTWQSASDKKAAAKAAKANARAAEKAAKVEERNRNERMKKEQEQIAKAEELLTKLVVESYERRRLQVAQSYDHRIAELRVKLETEKNLTVKAREAMNSQITSLEMLKERDLTRLQDEEMRKRIEAETKNIERYLQTVRKGSIDEYNLQMQKLRNEQDAELIAARQAEVDEETKQANILAIKAKYGQLTKELNDTLMKSEADAIKRRYETMILQSEVGKQPEVEQLRLQMEMRRELMEAAEQGETESIEEWNLRKLQLEKEYTDAREALADKQFEMEKAKMESIAAVYSGLSSLAEAFADENEAMAKASKMLALGEIAVNTGVALAEGIKQAQKAGPFPANLAAIATTVATILTNIATAVKTVKSAKFAEGGDVNGPGTETSDSVPAMLSDNESVITARGTRMFAPVLSVINQMGGGVPITGGGMPSDSAAGMEMLAQAVAMGVRSMPRPVVSVEEIDNVRDRVESIEVRNTI